MTIYLKINKLTNILLPIFLKHFRTHLLYQTHINIILRQKHFLFDNLEVYSYSRHTSEVEPFVKTVNSWKPLSIFPKSSILNIRLGSEYRSAFGYQINLNLYSCWRNFLSFVNILKKHWFLTCHQMACQINEKLAAVSSCLSFFLKLNMF